MEKNWYGFDHDAVNKRFPGGLTYVGDFCVKGEYHPVAVYKVANPDRSKGHKDYILLNEGYIRGMNEDEIQEWRYQTAIQCIVCKDVVYSVMRHHDSHCDCNRVSIDGGRDYTLIKFSNNTDYIPGRIDLLTQKFEPAS